MESTIKSIEIYEDNVIQMIVICNSCKTKNYHTITHASTKTKKKVIIIDFTKLGRRCCDNIMKCNADYKLYI